MIMKQECQPPFKRDGALLPSQGRFCPLFAVTVAHARRCYDSRKAYPPCEERSDEGRQGGCCHDCSLQQIVRQRSGIVVHVIVCSDASCLTRHCCIQENDTRYCY